ncbi:hypothetical protein ABE425_16860 [Chryseobacterium cucumeris]|uniref:hypothetical protein n=1 Tax=Chryseobacterium TaxID=59732 RepID=UPI0011D719FD|nr:hypothetical protein [Chryseobacterium sp. PCH239]QWT84713.1 hypothetical protein KBP46_14545 [Chryseobacterium sp. PCH239]TXJ00281.1 MAG: hypothetical protein E6Q35_01080 [Chryseobacterium cucumeris]
MEQIIIKLLGFLKFNDWESYKSLKNELLSVDTKNLIVQILNESRFRDTDVKALLLVIPELWKDFNMDDWMYIIRKVDRSANYRVLIDNEPCFEDIRFLYNWIGVDSIKLYQNGSGIPEKSKKSLDRVFPVLLTDPMREGELYKEDFQDGTFGDIKYFRDMKTRLISQGAKPSPMPNL